MWFFSVVTTPQTLFWITGSHFSAWVKRWWMMKGCWWAPLYNWPSWDSMGFLGFWWSLWLQQSKGRSWYPSLSFVLPGDNDGIIGFQQENSYYSRCSIHPPSRTTISPYWVTPQHTNKTLSSNHQAPTYTPNPPMYGVAGAPAASSPRLLAQPPHPPRAAPPLKHSHSRPSPFLCSAKAALKRTGWTTAVIAGLIVGDGSPTVSGVLLPLKVLYMAI